MATKKKTAEPAAATAASAKEKAAKTIEKTSAPKKAAAKKTACKTSVCVEMNGLSASVTDIQNAVKKALKDKSLEPAELKIYINAAEQAAYYTVDGEGGEDYKINLQEL